MRNRATRVLNGYTELWRYACRAIDESGKKPSEIAREMGVHRTGIYNALAKPTSARASMLQKIIAHLEHAEVVEEEPVFRIYKREQP